MKKYFLLTVLLLAGNVKAQDYHVTVVPNLGSFTMPVAPSPSGESAYGNTPLFGLPVGGFQAIYGLNNAGDFAFGSAGSGFTTNMGAAFGWDVAGPFGLQASNTAGRSWSINQDGEGTGFARNPTYTEEAFFFDGSTIMGLGSLGGTNSRGFSINDQGVIVGWSEITVGDTMTHAFLYDTGAETPVMVDLHSGSAQLALFENSVAFAINNQGQVVGHTSGGGSLTAYILDSTAEGLPANSLNFFEGENSRATTAVGLNENGQVVGWYLNANGLEKAVLWNDADSVDVEAVDLSTTFTAENGLGGASISMARGINADGWVVGEVDTSAESRVGFLYDGTESFNLNTLTDTDFDAKIVTANDINDHGQISGQAFVRYGERGGFSGVILSERVNWSGGTGIWDEAEDWQGGNAPTANQAAHIVLADAETLTGPAAEQTTIYAMTLRAAEAADVATLALGEDTTLTVRADTRLLGAVIDATATGSLFQTGLLWGHGTILGNAEAVWVWVDPGQTLTIDGTLATAYGLLLNDASVLRAAGVIDGPVAGTQTSAVEATGDLVIGSVATNLGVKLDTLDVGSHQVTLLDANQAEVFRLVLDGGTVTADNALTSFYINGHGTVDGDLSVRRLVRVTDTETLNVDGNVSGSGLVLGDMQATGTVSGAGSAQLQEDVAFANGDGMVLGSVQIRGNVSFENVNLTGIGSNNALLVNNRVVQDNRGNLIEIINHDVDLSGDLDIRSISFLGGTRVTVTGDSGLGTEGIGSFIVGVGASLDTGAHTVAIRSAAVNIANLSMNGGALNLSADSSTFNHLTGHGAVNGAVQFNALSTGYGLPPRTPEIVLTGNLSLGDAESMSGFSINDGLVDVGTHTLTLLNAGESLFNGQGAILLEGGTLNAANGIALQGSSDQGNSSTALLYAGGIETTSAVNGDIRMVNSIVQATDGNTLQVDGALTGTGVIIGDVQVSGGVTLAETGSVRLTRDIDIGASTATILSNEDAHLGTNTRMSGGTIQLDRANIVLGSNSFLSGHGTVTPVANDELIYSGEASPALEVLNGVIDVTPEETMTIRGHVTGYGVVMGHVALADAPPQLDYDEEVGHPDYYDPFYEPATYTLFDAPSGKVELNRTLALAGREAVVYSNAQATLTGTHNLTRDGFLRLNSYSSTGELLMENGAIASENGMRVINTVIRGPGTIHADTVLQNSVIDLHAAETLTIDGNLTGYGVVLGAGTIESDNANPLNSPTGQVNFKTSDQLLVVGDRDAVIYSTGTAIFGNVLSAGGDIDTRGGTMTLDAYEGHGSITGNLQLANSIVFVDEEQTLAVSGNFSGYGVVVGDVVGTDDQPKTIATPTGTVTLNTQGLDIGERSMTVYSAQPATFTRGSFGTRGGGTGTLLVPSGATFGSLRGNAKITLTTGNRIYISGVLAPGFSPGTIEIINGSLELGPSSITEIEYFGSLPGEYDFLDISETFYLGGTLKLFFEDGFDPAVGTILPDFFSAADVEGTFANITWQGLGAGKGVYFDYNSHQLVITDFSVIPEPSTWALLALGLGSLLLARHRAALRK